MPSTAPPTDAWLRDPLESGAAAGFGVYLHVPFCHHRCGYCDFATAAVGDQAADEVDALYERYVRALVADLGRQVAAGPRAHAPPGAQLAEGWPRVTSVFVGGGTPTLLPPPLLARLLTAVREELDVADDVEITVECNPETADEELFTTLADAGVTRLSLGMQSYATHVLRLLERGHGPDEPLRAAERARAAGIPAISLDLIYGTPGESEADWAATLERAVAAGVEHLSAYALTIHDNTPFGRRISRGELVAPDDDVLADRFELARQLLVAAGFDHYEVSNFAAGPVNRSRHNLLYWRHGDYLGVGVGAHGHLAGRRWWSTRSTSRYLEAVEAGGTGEPGATPVSGSEVLADEERAEERLLLGLRVKEGLHPRDVPPLEPLALEDALDLGLVETACGRLRSTERGWFLLDSAVERLLR
ncbi:MAG: radical SAM family heme chaperone HemW [Nitriliruptoraceae bacterium]